jgi:ABC-type multidrug transport system fused ATPase/permease subunit
MIKTLKKIFNLLDYNYKKKLLIFQLLLLLAAIFEMLGVLSIAPLIQIISNIDVLNDSSQLITKIYIYLDISSYEEFLKIIAISIFCIFLINFLLATCTLYFAARFAQDAGNFLRAKLFKVLSLQPWIFHSQRETSTYVNKINNECARISQSIALPLLQANARLLIGIIIIIAIFFYNPKVSTICFLTFFVFYFVIFKVVKKKIELDGFAMTQNSASIYKKILEAFGGIKETILHKKQEKFYKEFNLKTNRLAKATISIQFFQSFPKLFLELIAFSIIILSIIFTSSSGNQDYFQNSLPILGVYIFAGYKLLPIFQGFYFGLLSVKANIAAVDSVYDELKGNDNMEFINEKTILNKKFNLENKIEFRKISFSYNDITRPAINNISLNIHANSFNSIVGPSGGGKSTLLDILLGLLTPNQGEIFIDQVPLSSVIESFQQNISYVGQNIFLQNTTIKKNICFGLDQNEIDEKKLTNAIDASNLSELIDELPDGVNTMVGERGIKISGGQQQRVAIARALYLDRDIIILDEATSSLDGISENSILKRLKLFAENYKKTIIMVTHNINLTRSSDIIHLIDKGSLVESGDFNNLIKNDIFKKLLNE